MPGTAATVSKTIALCPYLFAKKVSAHHLRSQVILFANLSLNVTGVCLFIIPFIALACGIPVAAYPVTGPKDIIEHEVTGYLSDNLDRAIIGALKINKNNCIQESMKYSWENCSKQFESSLSLIN